MPDWNRTPLALYEPINTLKPIAEEVWIVDGPIVHMAFLVGSLPFTTRMTVVRLASGELFLHSPTQLTPELRREIDALGPVRHLVSPNYIHYAYIPEWAEAYPLATTWASPRVRERAARQSIQVRFDADLDDAPPAAWAGELDQLIFRGSRVLEEVVFFHRATRTLLLADLIENFEREKVAPRHRWMLDLAGAVDPDGKAPLDLRLTFLGRRKQAREYVRRMLEWNPERVILAHGRWYEREGAAELRRAFRWVGR